MFAGAFRPTIGPTTGDVEILAQIVGALTRGQTVRLGRWFAVPTAALPTVRLVKCAERVRGWTIAPTAEDVIDTREATVEEFHLAWLRDW